MGVTFSVDDSYLDVDYICFDDEAHREKILLHYDDFIKRAHPCVESLAELVLLLFEESFPLHCPKEGSFTGWKIGYLEYYTENVRVTPCLVELEIPEDAKRSSCYGNKCRCSKATVKSITAIKSLHKSDDGEISAKYEDASSHEAFSAMYDVKSVTYKVGETVYPDSFDDNRWHECSHGIHFFMTKEEAIEYGFDYIIGLQ